MLLEMTISRFQSVKRVYKLEPGLLRFLMANRMRSIATRIW